MVAESGDTVSISPGTEMFISMNKAAGEENLPGIPIPAVGILAETC